MWLGSMPGMDLPPMSYHKWIATALAIVTIPLAVWRGWLHWRARSSGVAYLLVLAGVLAALGYQRISAAS